MVIVAARAALCVGATIARSLVFTTMRKTTVVTSHPPSPPPGPALSWYQGYHYLLLQVRGVLGVTTMVEGAAPLLSPVVKVRVIVMELVMEGGMMVIEGAGVTWCVVVTTVGSMACTTMRRMIVVSLPPTKELVLISRSTGVSGGPGQHVIGGVG